MSIGPISDYDFHKLGNPYEREIEMTDEEEAAMDHADLPLDDAFLPSQRAQEKIARSIEGTNRSAQSDVVFDGPTLPANGRKTDGM